LSARDETKNLDNLLLILHTLKEYFQKTGNSRLRRATLKSLADDKLISKSNYTREQFGGRTFNSVLTRLESEDAIIPTRDKDHRFTEYFLNIPKIQYLIEQREYQMALGKITPSPIAEEKLFPEVPNVLRGLLAKKLEHNIILGGIKPGESVFNAQHITKNAVIDAAAAIAPNFYNFRIHSPNVERYNVNDKGITMKLLEIVSELASHSPETQFRLVLEYSGLPEHSIIWNKQVLKSVLPFMEFFCREILHYNFSKMDTKHIDAGQIELLSPIGKKYFDIFWKNHFLPLLREALL
jgi:hypothetical protein